MGHPPPLRRAGSPLKSRESSNLGKKKGSGSLPRVAMLNTTTPVHPRRQDSGKKQPPFRAGGRVPTGAAATTASSSPTSSSSPPVPGLSPRKSLERSRARPNGLHAREFTTSINTSPKRNSKTQVTGGAQRDGVRPLHPPPPAAAAAQQGTGGDRYAARKKLVKPPEKIARAISESQALSHMDSVDSSEDVVFDLNDLMSDIRELKSKLGLSVGDDVDQASSVYRDPTELGSGRNATAAGGLDAKASAGDDKGPDSHGRPSDALPRVSESEESSALGDEILKKTMPSTTVTGAAPGGGPSTPPTADAVPPPPEPKAKQMCSCSIM